MRVKTSLRFYHITLVACEIMSRLSSVWSGLAQPADHQLGYTCLEKVVSEDYNSHTRSLFVKAYSVPNHFI